MHRYLTLGLTLVALFTTTPSQAQPAGGPPAAPGVTTLDKLHPGVHYTVALVGGTGQSQRQGEAFVVTLNNEHDAYDQRSDLVSVFPLQSKNLATDRAVMGVSSLLPHLPIMGWLEYIHVDKKGNEWRTKHLVEVTAVAASQGGSVSLTMTSATPIRERRFKFPAFYGWTTK